MKDATENLWQVLEVHTFIQPPAPATPCYLVVTQFSEELVADLQLALATFKQPRASLPESILELFYALELPQAPTKYCRIQLDFRQLIT